MMNLKLKMLMKMTTGRNLLGCRANSKGLNQWNWLDPQDRTNWPTMDLLNPLDRAKARRLQGALHPQTRLTGIRMQLHIWASWMLMGEQELLPS